MNINHRLEKIEKALNETAMTKDNALELNRIFYDNICFGFSRFANIYPWCKDELKIAEYAHSEVEGRILYGFRKFKVFDVNGEFRPVPLEDLQ